jgi:hypothetical protein
MSLINVQILGVDLKDRQSPGAEFVVADGHAGQRGFTAADHVPAGSHQMRKVAQRRRLQHSMRIIGHDRGTIGC